jgi:ribose 1,5-bisphosphokinase PhnN
MKLLVFIGPSGSGKSTIARALHARGVIEVTPTWTTRPRRDDEESRTIEHRFVDDEEFTHLEQNGFFHDVVSMFGLPYRYGLPRVESPGGSRIPAVIVRAPLVQSLSLHYPDRVVYQIETVRDRARDRIESRSPADLDGGTRFNGWKRELALGRLAASRVFETGGSARATVADIRRAIIEDFLEERSGLG